MALSYLGERAGLPFPPFDLFDWLARVLPGEVLTAGIDALVSLITRLELGPTSEVAKTAEQILALLLFSAIGGLFGGTLGWLGRAAALRLTTYGLRGGALLFAAFWLVSSSLGVADAPILLIGLWLAVLLIGWGWSLGWMIQHADPALAGDPEAAITRRDFVRIVGGSIVSVSAGSLGLASILRREQAPAPAPIQSSDPLLPVDSPAAEVLAARIAPAPGTRSEITSIEDFYRIDINTRKPNLDPESWRLELGGLVNSPLSLTIDEIIDMPSISYYHTLSCISNRIGGDLISTTLWTGVPIKNVLDLAGMRSNAQELFIESSDGFYESVPMADLMNERTILAYAMNGMTLPHDHGYPLRIIIPNRYGMKQPKWIVNMEVIDHEGRGYWVERGWSEEAFVRTTSVIDSVAEDAFDEQTGTLPIGGIAYAGANGISRVEVQVDDGPWMDTALRAPALGPMSWVQWRLDWPRQSGRHQFRVRAYDALGQLQLQEDYPVRPNGATGIHELSATT
jgi:DMSO/TMAO reductase YedYZ molybdopterin-dependent catalytic subunit